MMTRNWGLPKPEYQIRISRSPRFTSVVDRGARPAVRTAASLVSKMAAASPTSADACTKPWEAAYVGRTSSSEAVIALRRLMCNGLLAPQVVTALRALLEGLPNCYLDRKSTRLNS